MIHEVTVLSYAEVSSPNLHSLRRAAAARGVKLTEWEPHRLSVWCDDDGAQVRYEDRPVQPAAVLHRTVARLRELVATALDVWADRGTVVLNDPASSARSRDKLATSVTLRRAGIPVVPSYGFFPWEGLSLGRLPGGASGSGEVIVKPAHGLRGRGVDRYPDASAAARAMSSVMWGEEDAVVSEHYIAQPLLGVPGCDIRAYVVDGRCVAAARRRAAAGEHRANAVLGASVTPLPDPHPARETAVAAVAAMGLDCAGVDIVEGGGRLSVLEVDAWAGFSALEEATGEDVAGAVVDAAIERVSRR